MASSTETPREPGASDDGATPEAPAAATADPQGPGRRDDTADDRIEDAEIVSDTPPADAHAEAAEAREDSPDETPPADRETAEQQTADGDPSTALHDAASEADPDALRAEDDRPEDQTPEDQTPDDRTPDDRTDDERAAEAADLNAAALAAGAGLAGGGLAAAAAPAMASGDSTGSAPKPSGSAQPPAEAPRGGMSLVLGGVIAAALGAGALWVLDNRGIVALSQPDLSGIEAQLAAQADRLAAAESALSGAEAQAEAAATTAAALEETLPATVADRVAADVAEATGPLSATIAEIEQRLQGLEALPVAQDPEAMGILQGFRSEVAALREELAETAGRAEALLAATAAAEARAEAAEGELGAIAAEAAEAEARAYARSALRQVEAAFDNGGPFDGALDAIAAAGVTVPEALPPLATSGVPTLAQLRAAYPPAAREALQIALRDVQDQPLAERMTAFLRLQFGMRSVTPRAGDDADAVLSRAEAALAGGDTGAALAELQALPEAVRAPLAGWIAEAETRRTAAEALAALAAEVESL